MKRESARWGDVRLSSPLHHTQLYWTDKKKAPKVEGAHTFWFCLFLVSLDGATKKNQEISSVWLRGRDFPLFHLIPTERADVREKSRPE